MGAEIDKVLLLLMCNDMEAEASMKAWNTVIVDAAHMMQQLYLPIEMVSLGIKNDIYI